jgi:WS/DGAT/MGAT family acyltransferase
MIDGVAGVDLMTVLLDVDPESKRPQPGGFIPRRVPTAWELLADGVSHRAMLPLRLLRGAGALFKEADDTKRELLVRLRAVASMLGWTMASADDTPFNREVGPHRRADWYAMDLARVKSVRARLGGSINDIVLTVVAGAVQRMLSKRRINPGSVDFRVLAPVSVRGSDERGRPGNRVSAWLIDLPVDRVDPRAQLDLVREQTRELKESRQAVGAELLIDAAEWAPSTLLALGTRNVTRMRLFDMIVTNVPGPQFPVYMAGARLLETYPVVPLFDNMGLGIALLSYDGAIYWGMNADYDLFPDTSEVVDAIHESFAALEVVAQAASDELTSSGGEVNIQPPAGSKSAAAGVGEASPAETAVADTTDEQVSSSPGEPPGKVTLN